MKATRLVLMYGAFMLVAGAAFFTLPYQVIDLYGTGVQSLSELEMILTRSIGVFMVGVGIMCWGAARKDHPAAREPLVLGLIAINGLSAAVAFLAAHAVGDVWFFWAEGIAFLAVAGIFAMTWRGAREAAPQQGF